LIKVIFESLTRYANDACFLKKLYLFNFKEIKINTHKNFNDLDSNEKKCFWLRLPFLFIINNVLLIAWFLIETYHGKPISKKTKTCLGGCIWKWRIN